MNRILVAMVWLLALLAAPVAGQDQSSRAEALYADAKAKEKAVRTALADPTATASVLKAVRTVVADYEALVRNFPSSPYSDDALWFGGWLAIDAFQRYGDEQERATGTRLWRALSVQYPSSKLARQVPQQLAKLGFLSSPDAPPPSGGAAPEDAQAIERSTPVPSPFPRPAAAPAPAGRAALATLKDIRRTVMPDGVRITVELDQEVSFSDERLENPARVVVDLSSTAASAELRDRTIRFDGDADLVHQIRIGRHPNNLTRVVLDVSGVSDYSVYPLYSPYRLVIDCVRTVPARNLVTLAKPPPPVLPSVSAKTPLLPPIALAPVLGPPAAAPALVSRMTAPLFGQPLPAAPAGIAAMEPPPLASSPVVPDAEPAGPPARNVGGGFSIARQLGLSVSRIVIDPGHGGHDPGATGKGVTEASVVLDVALRLEKLLAGVEGVEVILTRRTDDFVPLQERTAIANREGADLFLSIHANASSNLNVHGVETYFLNFATTSTAAAVAVRENAASGQPMAALPDFVKAIALHDKLDESRDFATHVQRALVERLRRANRNVRDLGVKQAPFVVLIGASMPSVLAEISFLTNSQEARLIRGNAYRQRIAEALFDAIRRYQGSLKTEAKIAQE
jgi:N-acetylmuramoyl-L-alanine amidase